MPMTTAMEVSTIPVESSVAVELVAVAKPTFTVKPSLSMEFTTAPAVMIPVSAKPTPAPVIAIPTPMPAAGVPAGMTPIPVIPGPYADKYAVHKPLRPVEAIGRAGVRVVIIVAVGTNWRRTNIGLPIVGGTNSQANDHSLRAGKRSAKKANSK